MTAGFNTPRRCPRRLSGRRNLSRRQHLWWHSTALVLVAAMLGHPQAASAQSTSGFTFGYDFVGVGDQSGGTGSTAEPAATYQGSYAFAFPVFDYSGGHLLAEYGIPQAWDKGFVPTDGQTAIFTSMSVGAPYNYIRVSQTYYPGEFSYTSDAPSYHIFVESGLVFTGSGNRQSIMGIKAVSDGGRSWLTYPLREPCIGWRRLPIDVRHEFADRIYRQQQCRRCTHQPRVGYRPHRLDQRRCPDNRRPQRNRFCLRRQ